MLDYGDYKKPLPDPCTLIVRFVPARVGSDMPSVSPEENHTPGTTWYIKISVNPIILIQTLLNLLIIIKTNNSNWKSIHTFEVSIISSNSGQVGQNLSKCIISWGKNCVSPICKYSVSRYLFQTQNIWLFVSKRHNAKVWLPPPPLSLCTDFQKRTQNHIHTRKCTYILCLRSKAFSNPSSTRAAYRSAKLVSWVPRYSEIDMSEGINTESMVWITPFRTILSPDSMFTPWITYFYGQKRHEDLT